MHTARNRGYMLTLLSSRKNKLSFAKWSVGRVRTYTLILLIFGTGARCGCQDAINLTILLNLEIFEVQQKQAR